MVDVENPPHPGEIVACEVIEPLGLSVTAAGRVLGVSRPALSAFLNGRSSLSPEMAIRIEKAFGPRMGHLMRMQCAFDIARAEQLSNQIEVEPYQMARS